MDFSSSSRTVDKLDDLSRLISSSTFFKILFAVSLERIKFCDLISFAFIFADSKLFLANCNFSSASLNLFSASCILLRMFSFLFLTMSVNVGRKYLLYKLYRRS